jgi:hypothetical protein
MGVLADSFGSRAVLVREALSSGITADALRHRRNGGDIMTLRKGLLVDAEIWHNASEDLRHRIALDGLIRSHPGSFASHDSAARLFGLPGDQELAQHQGIPICHITKPGQARRDGWARIHGGKVPEGLITSLHGIPTSDIVRCSIEQAATVSDIRAAAFIDAAMRTYIDTIRGQQDLRYAVHDTAVRQKALQRWHRGLDHFIGHRWVTRVRAAVVAAEPAAESFLESASRTNMVLAGVPKPSCGVPVKLMHTTFWLDFCWESARLIGEADGLGKYATVTDVVREKRREEALSAAGWTIVRWGWQEAVVHPHLMADRILRALSRLNH